MPETTPAVRIAIADAHPIFRDGLRKLFAAERDLAVVGDAGDGDQAITLVRNATPDILLLDFAMPGLSGMEVLRTIGTGTRTRTVVLTASIAKLDALMSLQLGAWGVVTKDATTAMLLKCIRSVMAGQHWIGREAVTDLVQLLRDLRRPDAERPMPRDTLTNRELDIVRAVVEGATNRDIASRYGLSEQTVKNHLSNVFDKLGVSSRLELALYAVNHRILER